MTNIGRALSHRTLRDAWTSNRDARPATAGAAGIDHISAAKFGSQLDAHIATIHDQIKAGTFQFSDLRVAPIPREDGRFRIIAIPTVRDRLVQRTVLAYLGKLKIFQEQPKISFGFIKGRSIDDALKQVVSLRSQRPWVLKTDIIRFFDEINREELKKIVDRSVRSKIVAEILRKSIDCELAQGNAEEAAFIKQNGIVRQRGLRQGMPVSPFLSNLYLKKFDFLLQNKRISAVRYADDLAVFCSDRNQSEDYLDTIRETLQKIGLDIPEIFDDHKTKILEPSHTLEFLGMEVRRFPDGYKIFAPSKKIKIIEEKMRNIATVSWCTENKRTMAQLLFRLDSMLAGYDASMKLAIDQERFNNKLQEIRNNAVNVFLSEMFGSNFTKTLNKEKRRILGIV